MPSVYITAPYPCKRMALDMADKLRRHGITNTSRWLMETSEVIDDEHARNDLHDVAIADALLILNPAGWEQKGTGGRHVELGYALAMAKPILLFGARSNVFHFMNHIRHAENERDLLFHLFTMFGIEEPA